MRINVEVTGSIIQSIDAERKKVEKATVGALNKTALWTNCQTSKTNTKKSDEKKVKCG